MRDLWDKIWRDKHGKVVIYQNPNWALIGWAVVTFVSLIVPRGTAQEVLLHISQGLLAIWSLLEIFKGVNYFRRALGVLILAITIAGIFGVGR